MNQYLLSYIFVRFSQLNIRLEFRETCSSRSKCDGVYMSTCSLDLLIVHGQKHPSDLQN